MNNYRLASFISLIIFFFIITLFAQNENGEQITVPLSDANQPGVLYLDHYKGKININGYEGHLVIIYASLPYKTSAKQQPGLERIPGQAIKLNAIEKNNTVTVTTNTQEKTVDLDIRLPYNFSVHIKNDANGKITVTNLDGELDISNTNDDIIIKNLSGSAILSTVDGNINVAFRKVTPLVPMAFTSLEGHIDVTFPSDLNAILKMKSNNGEILNDFNMDLSDHQQQPGKSPEKGTRKSFLEEWTYNKINNGGPEFLFDSYNGNIFIRKKD